MNNLLLYIHSLTNFSDKSWNLLQPILIKKEFKKSDFLLKEGVICNSLYFIVKGFCKSQYEIDGALKNTGFFFENEIATNINSFGNGLPSEYNIVACEPMETIVFDKNQLFHLAKQSSEIETLGRNCIRLFASKQEKLYKIHQLYNAQERYEYIEKEYPQFLKRISLSQLASFLGVTRETLSRIRQKRVSS